MAKITGDKGIVYIQGEEMPQRSSWNVDVTREMREGRVFNGTTGNSWVENASGFMSWSGSADGYFESGSNKLTAATLTPSVLQYITMYENRLGSGSSNYWYGTAWFDMSMTTSVDGFVDFNITFTGSGPLSRYGT
jgi:hypothetical protein